MKKIQFFVFAFVLTTCSLLSHNNKASADVFVWEDAQTGVVVSFPDTWAMVSNQGPDDILTIKAPSGRAEARCRVRMRSDERFKQYPVRFHDSVQRVAYSNDFWEQYFAEFSGADYKLLKDSSGIGNATAGYAVAEFFSEVPGPMMKRRGLAFAGNHFGELYIVECSSHRDAFVRWKGQFLAIAGSVQMPKYYHEIPTGHYRPFIKENINPVRFPGDNAVQRIIY